MNAKSIEPRKYPLTPIQKGMYFQCTLAQQPYYYVIQQVCKVEQQFSERAFKEAWLAVFESQPVFQLGMGMDVNGEVFQYLDPELTLPISIEDLSTLSSTEQNKTIETFQQDDMAQGFDLNKPPYVRIKSFITQKNSFAFIFTIHHIITDGWSTATTLNKFFDAYQSLLLGKPVSFTKDTSFFDYLKKNDTKMINYDKQFWSGYLKGATPDQLFAIGDKTTAKKAADVIRTQTIKQNLELKEYNELKTFAEKSGFNTHIILQACWSLLLAAYAQSNDVVFGVVRGCREQDNYKYLVSHGVLINTLPYRIAIDGQIKMIEFLEKAHVNNELIRQHSTDNLFKLNHEFRANATTELFSSLFTYLPYTYNSVVRCRDNTRIDIATHRHIPYALGINCFESDTLYIELNYDEQRFSEQLAQGILNNFIYLLSSVHKNANILLKDISIISPFEKNRLLIEWNNTKVPLPKETCIHQLFESQVEKTPNATAIIFEDNSLTYAELNAKANQLAHYLKAKGVGPEILVGVYLERSLEMVISLLAILKTGGAYLPLDTDYPKERIAYMLEDAKAKWVITNSEHLDALPSVDSETVVLDKLSQKLDKLPIRNLNTILSGDNLAYVIYTSGSTGKPKGVANIQIALVNRLLWMQREIEFTAEDVVIQKTPFSFDVSVWEFFLPLITGAKLVMARPEGHKDPVYLIELIRQSAVTTIHFVPSMLSVFLSSLASKQETTLRTIICSGEALPADVAMQCLKLLDANLYNFYGPTEAAIDVSAFRCTEPNASVILIGKPIDNIQLFILDKNLNPVPIGVSGELHIGGMGLARGYLNKPELTREKFIESPFSKGERLYKTGDLARYLRDGNIEYLGRIDNQVKIRGFRIECGEIEAAILTHEKISQAVVIAHESEVGKQLLAYVVSDDSESKVDTQVLREYLLKSLPDYMVPAFFIELDKLPLTPNGKIDKKALLIPDASSLQLAQEYVAPSNPLEEIVASIWSEVLKLERVGIHDNFFELGGHSLLATQVISRIRNVTNMEVPLKALFEAPTVKSLVKVMETASKTELPPIEVCVHDKPMPLSFAQERLWFLSQLEGESATYNIPLALRLSGKLNVSALTKSLNTIVQRHEVLRTRFINEEGQPLQVVDSAELKVRIMDLTTIDKDQQLTQVKALANQEAVTPFNLSEGPLIRAQLTQLDNEGHVLFITVHHIVSDGWSMGILMRELTTFYNECLKGNDGAAILPALKVQYADYSQWQRETLTDSVLEKQLSYWQEKLSGALPVLNLPTDYTRPKVQTFKGDFVSVEISKELTEKLNTLAKANQATLYMVLLAAFKVLLARYSNQTDIVVGSPIAGRTHRDIESLIGFFVNTLVLRDEIADNPSFTNLIARVKQTALEAYANQEVPFEKLVEVLKPERDMSHSPLFQVMFVLQNQDVTSQQFEGLSTQRFRGENAAAKFDLTLGLTQTNEGLKGSLNYTTDLFTAETIERLLDSFQRILEHVVTAPEQTLSQIEVLSKKEKQHLLVEWNNTKVPLPKETFIHQLFEAQVEKTPNATAVVFEDKSLTYAELNARANQLAHYLKSTGVDPEVLVGVYLERSLEMIISLLAILKVGGVYLPLDTEYPKERIAYMLQDSQIKLVITQNHLVKTLPASENSVLVLLDLLSAELSQYSGENLKVPVSADNLAYVIYTSGSTGKPKGVMISQGAIGNYIVWACRFLPLTAKQKVLQKTSINFDPSVREFFLPLVQGAQLVIAPVHADKEFDLLRETILKYEITHLQLVSSVLKVFIADERFTQCKSLEVICTGGDPLDVHVVKKLKQTFDIRVINLYGPTESTINSCYWEPEKNTIPNNIPIGKPLDNYQLFILDKHLNPVPIGASGELHIGGMGLARGYLHKPELTKEKFIESPFTKGERLYKTGDLTRYLPDGNIEYLGRIDNQVKIRGFRIECGEIEAAILMHETVTQAVVIAHESDVGKQLVAYVVCNSDASVDTQRLREHVRKSLPDFMVPTFFITLDKLPLTPNGKIDKKALPIPDVSSLQLTLEYVAPSNLLEEIIASIWSEVLKLERVSVHDNFFELGGHSLLATQVISRIRSVTDIEVPLKALFEAPTVKSFVKIMQSASKTELSPIEVRAHDKPMPLSFAQERLWFLAQLEGESATYNIPIALRLSGTLNVNALKQSLNAIVQRHESLRTRFLNEGGQPRQVVGSIELKVTITNLTTINKEQQLTQVKALANQEAATPFNLSEGPLIRGQIIQLDPENHVLLITVHHIVSDGWSMELFLGELTTFYNELLKSNDGSSILPALKVQYADYSQWQRDTLTDSVLEKQLGYWKEKLDGALPVLELAADYPRPKVQTFKGDSASVEISKELTEKLTALATANQATLYMVLLAAFKVLLARYSNQTDIVVGSPIAGRTHRDIESLIGFFVNTLVLRDEISDNPTFIQFIKRVRQTALEAYANQDVPFEKLVEVLKPERDMSHSPLFQVMFVLQNQDVTSQQFEGLSIERFRGANHTAKFDLILSLVPTEEGLKGNLNYTTDLFTAATIKRLLDSFQRILEHVVTAPEQTLSKIEVLSETDKQHLLGELNTTQAQLPKEPGIHQLFEAQVEKIPNATAVDFEDKSLTYRELNARANQLAHYLKAKGVGPDVIVAVYLGRCVDTLISLLGILKAGGAYLPLDPNYPAARLDYMINDAEAILIITNSELATRLPSTQTPRLVIDDNRDLLEKQSSENPKSQTSLQNLCYIIYTSGSTGKPKGVAVPHETLINLLTWHIDTCGGPKTVLQFAALSFDISLLECFTAWLTAGRLCMITEEQHQDIAVLADLIQKYSINMITFPVVVLQQFSQMHVEHKEKLRSLTDIISSGEQLQISTAIIDFFKALPHCRLHNQYGPSESHVVTAYTLPNDPSLWSAYPSIGKPIYNTQIYLLDRHLNPVPRGACGELYIGGVNLARGYLNKPELTQEKFIESPFVKGERLYKTGDLARYLTDGNIEYLGRIDNQVKIRGFRIECGEIEAAILTHEKIAQAVVVVYEGNVGKQLVAYVVSDDSESSVDTQILREHLRTSLPDYMVPAFFIELDTLPLTPNGKIDKKALPTPDASLMQLTHEYVAPSNPIEEIVASIWSEVLKLERVSVHDNFFELGGHSLLATQVISWIRSVTNIEVPIRALFEAPTVKSFVKVMESANKSQLPQIKPIAHDKPMPLSFAQERLWFLAQFEGESATYNIPMALRLSGKLNVSALAQSLNAIMKRHEVLRTRFINEEGQPRQVVDSLELKIAITNLTTIDKNKGLVQAKALATIEAATPFNLAEGPLIRAQLIQLDEEDNVLLITTHHIVSDGWSMGILMRELTMTYNKSIKSNDGFSIPSALKVQYADYSQWQRETLTDSVLEKQLSYWQEKLSGALPVLNLPTDYPRPKVQTFKGDFASIEISKELTEKLTALAKANQATLYMVLLAAFKVLLARYSNQTDIVVGSPIAGRTHRDIEALIGFFVNTLVLRDEVSDNLSFTQLITRVRQTALEAYANQEVPFEKLVEVLKPERDTGHSPLFQVMFVLQNQDSSSLQFEGLNTQWFRGDNATAKFDLTLGLASVKGKLIGSFNYNTELFTAVTIKRLLDSFQRILEHVVTAPEQTLSQIELLSENEKQQLLVEWNNTQVLLPKETSIHQLFESQVEKVPNAIAIVFEDKSLTYAELNARANQLAHYLKAKGVGPEVLVAVYLERSLEMVISLLAILKAGGAYLPLDTEYPKERIAYMLEDAKAKWVITQSEQLFALPSVGSETIVLDKLTDKLNKLPTLNLNTLLSGDNLAYVIYTSGSTGKPKGVAIEHLSAVNFIQWSTQAYSSAELQCMLAGTSICFDLSIFEIFVPLSMGGKVVLVENTLHLQKLSARNDITIINTVPSVIKELLRLEAIPTSVATINLAGEPLDQSLVEQLYRCKHVKQVFDLYGPSEDTTYSTFTKRTINQKANIGKPIANKQIYILDKNLNPAPIGVPGELHIGGMGLARGYLHKPELTKEKFIESPFNKNERLYKTGDLARYLPDGNIEYLGRIDNQVKIRGFRIECGEIEAALMTHEKISQAVVVVHEVEQSKQLVAYWVSEAKVPAIDSQVIREYLRQTLPDSMIPSYFICLDALPLTPNGKVDRKALLKPELYSIERQTYQAPQTPLEISIATVWKQLLLIDKVDRHDSFFDLGGHSLLSIKAIYEIEKQTGFTFTSHDIQFNNLQQLAALFDKTETSTVNTQQPSKVQERLEPFYINVNDQALYNCLHHPVAPAKQHTVVICNPIGHEYLSCHRALRKLAQVLSQQGYHVLRFDYSNFGDSTGNSEEFSLTQSIADIHSVITHLRSKNTSEKISLAGIRVGANLAVKYCQQYNDINDLVLWAPITNGAEYLQQIGIVGSQLVKPEVLTGKLHEYMGQIYNPTLIKEIHELELNSVNITEKRTLIVVDADYAAGNFDSPGRDNHNITIHTDSNSQIWNFDPSKVVVPQALLHNICDWLS